ncbi:MAG: DUF4956 domain-containing protein [Gemmatimonadaceae bacterium]|nr:DUF4956 domain-containing protein [Gemmatimonadaceae bacterium]
MSRAESETAPGLSVAARRLLAIVAYYAVGTLIGFLAWRQYPAVRELLAGARPQDLAALPSGAALRADTAGPAFGGLQHTVTTTLLVLVGALATALPLAWVYSLTRRRRGFSQSMVHILVLLPVAVAGMVMLIQNSLALAFSLAGIVAVLRFRNSLDDVKDGVYIFVAVSIGISASLGALMIGILTSSIFAVCVTVLWWLDFARRPVEGKRRGWRTLARLPRVAPVRERKVPPEAGDEVFASAARAWRRQLQITAEQQVQAGEDRFNATLRIRTTDGAEARSALEEVMEARTRRWELRGITPAEQGTTTLTYRVRVRREGRGELLDALQAVPRTVGVELR